MNNLKLGMIFALISMFGFGFYQFFLKKNVKNLNIYSLLIYVHTFLIISIVPSLFFIKIIFPSLKIFLLILLTSLIGAVNLPFFYRAISKGKLSIVIPIVNTYALFAIIFALIMFRETLRISQYLFGGLIIIGIILIVLKRDKIKNLRVDKEDIKPIIYAMIFSVGLGFYSNLLKPIEESVGPILGFFYTEIFVLIFFLIYYLKGNVKLQTPEKAMWKYLIITGVFQAVGGLFFFIGIKYSNVSITSMISSANPLIVIMLAYTILKEKMEWNQLIGVLITIIGLIGLGI